MRLTSLLLTLGFLFLNGPAGAAGLDAASSQALAETGNLILDPELRADALAQDPASAAAAAKLKALLGSSTQKEQDAYKLGTELFAKIAQEENGDMDKIAARLKALESNPESLGLSMSLAQKEALRALASDTAAK